MSSARHAPKFAELRLARLGGDGARARIERVLPQVQDWTANEPGAVIGPLITEFREAYARVTGVERVDQPEFVMHKQYVDYRCHAAPYRFEALQCEASGLFRATGPQHFTLERATSDVPMGLGVRFGAQYRCLGSPVGRVLPGRASVRRPSGETHYPLTVYLGLKDFFIWTFEHDDELEPGEWHFTIAVYDAKVPTDFPVSRAPEPQAQLAAFECHFTVGGA